MQDELRRWAPGAARAVAGRDPGATGQGTQGGWAVYGCYCGLTGIGVARLSGSGGPLVAYRALRGERDLAGRLVEASAAVRWVAGWLCAASSGEARHERGPTPAVGPTAPSLDRPGPGSATVGLAAYPAVRRRWMAERLYETGVLLRVELVRRGWTVREERLERLGTDVERDDRETVLRRAVLLARMARGAPAAGADGRVFYAAGR